MLYDQRDFVLSTPQYKKEHSFCSRTYKKGGLLMKMAPNTAAPPFYSKETL